MSFFKLVVSFQMKQLRLVTLYLGKIQVGSLAGAAHLLKDNAGVQ